MDKSTKEQIEKAIIRIKENYTAGLSDKEFKKNVDESVRQALEGEPIEEIIKFLEKAGINEKQLLEALDYIEKNGIKKYVQSLLQKCIELYKSGTLKEKIKEYLDKTKISEEAKARIFAEIGKIDAKTKGIRDSGKNLSSIYNKGKKMVIGFGVLIIFLTISVIYLLLKNTNK